MVDVSPTAGMQAPADPHQLFLQVCSASGMPPNVVRGPRRDKRAVDVRRKVARVLREARCSLPQIGRILGGRHHTTVMQLLNPDIGRRKYLPKKLSRFAREEAL